MAGIRPALLISVTLCQGWPACPSSQARRRRATCAPSARSACHSINSPAAPASGSRPWSRPREIPNSLWPEASSLSAMARPMPRECPVSRVNSVGMRSFPSTVVSIKAASGPAHNTTGSGSSRSPKRSYTLVCMARAKVMTSPPVTGSLGPPRLTSTSACFS